MNDTVNLDGVEFEGEVKASVETHELTYNGLVDVDNGTLMGRGMNGKIWSVIGVLWDVPNLKTTIVVEEFVQQ